MDEGASTRPTNTPEESGGADDNAQSAAKNAAAKDRKCQYCDQAFTSSSLGRHLDQFLFKKKPDGIHDVEEIRRIRSSITRRQARTSSGKRDTPERTTGKGPLDSYSGGESGGKPRDSGIRMMFNTPTWHATGVINDIPNPSHPQEPSTSSRLGSAQPRASSLTQPEYGARNISNSSPDTVRALELALQEVLDNVKAATYVLLLPFAFDTTRSWLTCAIDLGCVLPYRRLNSTFRRKPFLRSVCSCSPLRRAFSRRVHSPLRPHFLFILPVLSTLILFDKLCEPRLSDGSRTNLLPNQAEALSPEGHVLDWIPT